MEESIENLKQTIVGLQSSIMVHAKLSADLAKHLAGLHVTHTNLYNEHLPPLSVVFSVGGRGGGREGRMEVTEWDNGDDDDSNNNGEMSGFRTFPFFTLPSIFLTNIPDTLCSFAVFLILGLPPSSNS
jgi:hypothetical protein